MRPATPGSPAPSGAARRSVAPSACSAAPGDGIVIWPCSSVHMFFMRFALDVVYVDKERRVVRAVQGLKPWRVSFGGKGAHAAIELPVGAIAASGTQPGDQLTFD